MTYNIYGNAPQKVLVRRRKQWTYPVSSPSSD